MSTDHDVNEPRRVSGLRPVLWGFALLLACYVSLFAAVAVDEFVFHSRFIEQPLRAYSPALCDRFGEFFRTIYAPVIGAMKVLKIIPP